MAQADFKIYKKCPFCRKSIDSIAPNISFQSLILSANDKRELVVKKMKAKLNESPNKT